jgi:hypothetical protein
MKNTNVALLCFIVVAGMLLTFVMLSKGNNVGAVAENTVQQVTQQQQQTVALSESPANLPTYYIKLVLTPKTACINQQITGTITSAGLANSSCSLYYKVGVMPTWFNYKTFNLDTNGSYTEATSFPITGSVKIYVKCKNIESNEESLKVSEC